MRLGIDGSNLRSGGAITHLSELLRHADPAAHGFSKVTLWGAWMLLDRVPERPWLDRVHVPQLDRSLPFRVAWQLFERPALVQATSDVLFAPGATPAAGFRPFVTMSQNMLPFDPRGRIGASLSQRMRLLLLKLVVTHSFRHSDAVIFLTDYAKEKIGALVDRGVAKRSFVIPHGVGAHFHAAPRAALPFDHYTPETPFRFVYVSDRFPYKQHAVLAEAVLKLRAEGMPVELELIGEAVMPAVERDLERVLERYPAEREAVCILSSVPHDKLPAVYRDADAFVFPSTCENLPITLLEAMASSLPIAASNVRPMPDIAGEHGTYFDAEDVDSVAGALRRVATDHELRARSSASASARAAEYSWKRCVDETFAVLARVSRMARVQERHGCS